jgi:hypothetical protein
LYIYARLLLFDYEILNYEANNIHLNAKRGAINEAAEVYVVVNTRRGSRLRRERTGCWKQDPGSSDRWREWRSVSQLAVDYSHFEDGARRDRLV